MQEGQEAPAPKSFRTVKTAQCNLKIVGRVNREMAAADAVVPQAYKLLLHAQNCTMAARDMLMNEAAKALKYASRHEMFNDLRTNNQGIEVDDETGEVRIYEEIKPEITKVVEQVDFTPKPHSDVCKHCDKPIFFQAAAQHFLHGLAGGGAAHRECIDEMTGDATETFAQPK